ncbi:urea ABC transporter ATP-binding subunit UrtE [Rhodoferax sp.]|uniref:urea ABC transporter ATP-binding subunit UrtE n=1 Tax=Rhodoferax sp. TaxID=50421 RepID=UPI00260C1392|nr:urea ABC transporter ATP-binding subunit UrtE [Rhodoferax sp.]MDD2917511.1 urea ABC transporter ATP-binding subunit UrtE [Rhodoferax sp.]
MLNITGLNQYYGGGHVLRNIELSVPDGSCTVLLGRNGVGKTTLLRCLMGLLPIRSGSISFVGRDISRDSPQTRARAGMGYVPQGREVFPDLTVDENLRIGALTGERRLASAQKVFTYSDVNQLFPVLKTMSSRVAGNLSGGQQQQLAIARALLTNPTLLILDEPTEGIQPSIVQEIEAVIQSLKGQMSILLVEQFYDFAAAVADQYVVLVRGQVVAHGLGRNMETDKVHELITF